MKLYIVVKDIPELRQNAGKLAVQVAHAVEGLTTLSFTDDIDRYLATDSKTKICLKIKPDHFEKVLLKCIKDKLTYHIVTDNAKTVFERPTETCFAVGPFTNDNVPNYLKRLRLVDW